MMLMATSGKFGYALYDGTKSKEQNETFTAPAKKQIHGPLDKTVRGLVLEILNERLDQNKIAFYTIKVLQSKEDVRGNDRMYALELGFVGEKGVPCDSISKLVDPKSCLIIVLPKATIFYRPEGANQEELKCYGEVWDYETKRYPYFSPRGTSKICKSTMEELLVALTATYSDHK